VGSDPVHSHQHEEMVESPADAVFAGLIDIYRLPEWNHAISAVTGGSLSRVHRGGGNQTELTHS
jgi:hypothetical protein